MELTKEQLIEHAEAQITYLRAALEIQPDVGASELLRLMEIALAALTAGTGPVAYMYRDKLHTDARSSLEKRFGNWSQEDINEYGITEIPLYAAPQLPQPVPDEKRDDDGNTTSDFDHGWNACRAAMLLRVQGADHETD